MSGDAILYVERWIIDGPRFERGEQPYYWYTRTTQWGEHLVEPFRVSSMPFELRTYDENYGRREVP